MEGKLQEKEFSFTARKKGRPNLLDNEIMQEIKIGC